MRTINKEKALAIACQLCLRAKDVSDLTGYGLTVTYRIMGECRRDYDGLIRERPDAITTESLMRYFKTTRSDYMRSLEQ
jgi:hypothetical protein